ncbi:family 43 glycosylhydrolase [Streptomyces johnsoniae]|uniref:Family 43 glycosylhydrolase n=1 Tax=Streptomyces johnsoniae TaxID=3075532 RepID=A0ABU2SE35_9ACTN|nr:family 43 glycosylhydrolase [Streptomyces sp. DSM 41886]MDT0446360.1 family 43 glycosylhydrolase [Streptomyces sp. DSM 41886]
MTRRRPFVRPGSAMVALVLAAVGLVAAAGPAATEQSGYAARTAGPETSEAASEAPADTGPMANPIVTDIYTADPATLVVDGTAYIFTGRDEAAPGQQQFVMHEWHAFSSRSPSNDQAAWQPHGAVLSLDTFAWAGANAWASEVVQGPDGRFYWFVSVDGHTDEGWMNIGVAVAGHPLGPYRDAIGGPLISDATPNSSALNIDPTVFIDGDGEIYLHWGSYWEPRAVRLQDTMTALDGEVFEPAGLTGFWEAPWLFERDGVHYLAYASNSGADCVTDSAYACIRYATADSPAGPWTHRGVVLDQVSSTTNHPAIMEFGDQWYMVYHTADAPGGGNFRRSVALDELNFNPDGTMQKVVQTP